jgi:hypothetical protein
MYGTGIFVLTTTTLAAANTAKAAAAGGTAVRMVWRERSLEEREGGWYTVHHEMERNGG